MEEEPLKIKGCLTRETEKEFIKIKVGNEDDFYRLVKRVDSPIFDCTETGDIFAIDPKNKIQYVLKK